MFVKTHRVIFLCFVYTVSSCVSEISEYSFGTLLHELNQGVMPEGDFRWKFPTYSVLECSFFAV